MFVSDENQLDQNIFGFLLSEDGPNVWATQEAASDFYECYLLLTEEPSVSPSGTPSIIPSRSPSISSPSEFPSVCPSFSPSVPPTTLHPGMFIPSISPSRTPSGAPVAAPTVSPSFLPSTPPTDLPSHTPTKTPTSDPVVQPTGSPSVVPSISPSIAPTTTVPSNCPSVTPTTNPSVTSPCNEGKMHVYGTHFLYLDEAASGVADDDTVNLVLRVPNRYTIEKVSPSDADTEAGYYTAVGANTYWSMAVDETQECTQELTGGFPWSGIADRSLMGLTTVTNPQYYENVDDGTYFHNILTLELSEEYDAPEGWARPGEESTITRKIIYEIPWLILLQTQVRLNVSFSAVLPTPAPSASPTVNPSFAPSVIPSQGPSLQPSLDPTSSEPSVTPTLSPSFVPTKPPSFYPSATPSFNPTQNPSSSPTPRTIYYVNVTVRADGTFMISEEIATNTFDVDERFTMKVLPASGSFSFRGTEVTADFPESPPSQLGQFQWQGVDLSEDTFVYFVAESQSIRVVIDIFLLSPRDCTASFTEWAACSVTCGDGSTSRTWVVTEDADSSASCAHEDQYTETEACNDQPCPLVDEIVTNFAVYNPNLDEASHVCLNFTTITVLPWKVVDDGFSVTDPNEMMVEDSIAWHSGTSCWPPYNYTERPGICGFKPVSEANSFGLGYVVNSMQGYLASAKECRSVCDFFTKCDAWSFYEGSNICEVLGPEFTQAEAAQATTIFGSEFFFTTGDAGFNTVTDGYVVPGYGWIEEAICNMKTDLYYEGYCFQDFALCFDMDFVCNINDFFYLNLRATNLLTASTEDFAFETRMATDGACATIIGDTEISGSLEVSTSPDRTSTVVQIYLGDTVYFTVRLHSKAVVQSMTLKDFKVLQDESTDAVPIEYPPADNAAVTLQSSDVNPTTQEFDTVGTFDLELTAPLAGSVEGTYTKFTAAVVVTFTDGRRQLVEGTYNRDFTVEANSLIYPPKCHDPEADAGEYFTHHCDVGKRILYCNNDGHWTILVDECGGESIVFGAGSESETIIIDETQEDNPFAWRTSALAIAFALLCGCCVYFFMVSKNKKKHLVTFDHPDLASKPGYQDPEESCSSYWGSDVESGKDNSDTYFNPDKTLETAAERIFHQLRLDQATDSDNGANSVQELENTDIDGEDILEFDSDATVFAAGGWMMESTDADGGGTMDDNVDGGGTMDNTDVDKSNVPEFIPLQFFAGSEPELSTSDQTDAVVSDDPEQSYDQGMSNSKKLALNSAFEVLGIDMNTDIDQVVNAVDSDGLHADSDECLNDLELFGGNDQETLNSKKFAVNSAFEELGIDMNTDIDQIVNAVVSDGLQADPDQGFNDLGGLQRRFDPTKSVQIIPRNRRDTRTQI